MKAIDSRDHFLIVNTVTNIPIESWGSRAKADYFCKVCNEHEIRNGREPIYVVKELTAKETRADENN